MTVSQYLLVCLAEECGEIAKRAIKAARFGIGEIQPEQYRDNAERIIEELGDLDGVLNMLRAESPIFDSAFRQADLSQLADAKVAKLKQFMEYSRKKRQLV